MPTTWPPAGSRGVPAVLCDSFSIRPDPATPGTVQLCGKAADGSNPARWPSLTPEGAAAWTPDRSAATPPTAPGGWWTLTHTFPSDLDFTTLRLDWDPLDLRDLYSATLSACIVRNADLLPEAGAPTNPAFLYRTPEVGFPDPVVPLIHRPALPPFQPAAALPATIESILIPIATLVPPLASDLHVAVGYRQAMGLPRPVLRASLPFGPQGPALPTFLAGIAGQIAAWHAAVAPRSDEAQLAFSLTLFGQVNGERLPLVQIDEISVIVSAVPPTWWRALA
jgi:hypothetical protein